MLRSAVSWRRHHDQLSRGCVWMETVMMHTLSRSTISCQDQLGHITLGETPVGCQDQIHSNGI